MDSRHYWEDNGGPVKYENSSSDGYGRQADANLNFATGALASEDDGDYISSSYLKKGKVSRQDPMSHRIIEKRRRDRMNNCLADLSRLIPPDYCKKGRGRVEKTEIIEMAIRHLKYLQERSNGIDSQQQEGPISVEHFRLGYQECRSEVMRYLVEAQGYLPTDTLCVHLVGHLNRHCDSIMKGDQLNQPRSNPETTSSSSGSSGNYGGDKPSVIALAHRAPSHEPNNNSYHKRLYEPTGGAPAPPYAPSPDIHDDYITLPYYTEETDAPLPLTRAPAPHEQTNLRSVRKLDRDDYAEHAHSYKFKNTIKQRFSQDCDDEAHDMSLPAKRRRPIKQDSNASAATSFTSSNDEGVCRDASPEPLLTDEPRGLPPHLTPEPPPKSERERGLHIPVFALHTLGKYYVPLNVSYDCLSSFVGPYDLLRCSGATNAAPLHPVSINVNFQPFEHVKPKTESGRKWRPA